MLIWAGESHRFTEEDERVLESLCSGGFLDPGNGFSVLEVVNAARTFERARIIENLDTLPPADRALLMNLVVWLTVGAPDNKKEG